MSKEFGLYPNNVPHYWIGARMIVSGGEMYIPWDRWSSEFHSTQRKHELISWVNNYAIDEVMRRIKEFGRDTGWHFFDSEDGKFRCEYDDRNSGGYVYLGFYNLTLEEGEY